MSKIIGISGERFGRLTALRKAEKHPFWEFKCDCGSVRLIRVYDVLTGKSASCGCLKRDVTALRNKDSATKGGLTHTPTGSSWRSMLTRCYNKNNHTYAAYGAVGINVCEFLRATPVNLILLIGVKPKGTSLDRINNLEGYHCGSCAECLSKQWAANVKWSTPTEQGRNQRTNHLVTVAGETKCLSEWGEITGLGGNLIRNRIKRGWSGERLLSPRVQRVK